MSDLRGTVCRGRPGLVTGRKALPWGPAWVGVALDDGPVRWSSRDPQVIAPNLAAWLEARADG